jgi:hypothetical protein
VAKQKCGSCLFFQEAGLAGSGWCHHPQRKVSSGVLIMVRRNELACRDEWSRSLWQPAAQPNVNGAMPFQRPLSAGPLPPAQPENMRSLLGRDPASFGQSEGEDVLLSEARIVSEAHKPWEPTERPFSTANFDPRTAIFRARETYRERARAKAAANRQAGAAEATSSEEPHSRDPQWELNESATDVGESAAPESKEGLATRRPPEHAAEVDRIQANPADGEPSQRDNALVSAAELVDRQPQEFNRIDLVRSTVDGPASETSSVTLPVVVASEIAIAAADAPDEPHGASQWPVEPESEPVLEPLPSWFRNDLPRLCRSCRDYRPAADGQRGWCANAWAFTHRRLVHEDDLAPCQSAIGDWWTPVDDVWLVAADVSSHGRATPLFDRLTGKLDPQRRRS